jgi:uncharacterized protein
MSIINRAIKGTAIFIASLTLFFSTSYAADMSRGANNFYTSEKVNVENIRFKNMYGMEIVGTLFTPKQMEQGGKYPALVVGHPFRAVRQQAANLYATRMAEEGFVTLSFDQSFWGESAGEPRGSVLPDVYVENFSASVDYLGTRPFVNQEKIGIIGICGSGGFSIAAAKIDPRIKALATVAMYNMGDFFRTGLQHVRSVEERNKILEATAAQRYGRFETGQPIYRTGHSSGPVSPEAKDSYDFYETERGKVVSNNRLVSVTSYQTFMNFYPFSDIGTISPRPILFVVGDKAPSRHYTDEAYELAKQPKELYVVKDATRLDLYDRMEVIPWDKLTEFFDKYLNSK